MWVLSAYEKRGDRLIAQQSLNGVDAGALRRLWNRPDDDPMYYSYPVTSTIAETLARHVSEPLRTDDFDYFVEYLSQERTN